MVFIVPWFPTLLYIYNSKQNIKNMASTSIKNTPGNYDLEQCAYQKQLDYMHYIHSAGGTAYTRHFAGNGLLAPKMNPLDLAENYIDVESQLLGIGQTNLVKPLPKVSPNNFNFPSLNIIDKTPMIIPEPIHYLQNQRANYRN